MDKLVGRVINGIFINEEKTGIVFGNSEYDDGDSTCLYAFGDCCSRSWIEHVSIPKVSYGNFGTVVVVEQIDMSELNSENDEEFDYIKVYGYKIITDRGEIFIELRNSSNGYYGGSLELGFVSGNYSEIETDF